MRKLTKRPPEVTEKVGHFRDGSRRKRSDSIQVWEKA